MPKTPHLTLARSGMRLRIRRSIVGVPVAAMWHRHHDLTLRRNIAAQLVRRDTQRQLTLPFQQLAKEPFCTLHLLSLLNENVRYIPVLADHTPTIPPLASGRHDHLVEILAVSATSKARLDTPSELRLKPRAPLTNRLVRHLYAALGEQVFDVTQTQRKTMVEPLGAGNGERWKQVTAVQGYLLHTRSLSDACLT